MMLRIVWQRPVVLRVLDQLANPGPKALLRHPGSGISTASLTARPDASRTRQLTRFNLAIDFTARWQCFQVIHGLEIQPELGRRVEVARKTIGCVGRDAAPLLHDFM